MALELYVPKNGEPRFGIKTFLNETVRLADTTTREVMNISNAGKANVHDLAQLADACRHAANRLSLVAEDLAFKAKEAKAAAKEGEE